MTINTPLRHSRQRHALLHQVGADLNTPQQWRRTRNPAKTDPASGLPDYLYTVADPARRPSPTRQRAVRELDRHGLLSATPADSGEALGLSALGEQTLASWNASFGAPRTG